MLKNEGIEFYSGCALNLHKLVRPLRNGFYKVLDITVGGDAPKNFIAVYNYGKGVHKNNCHTWPKYIAKVGQKWYPIESVTEHLLNCIGKELGLKMAHSELYMAGNQLRFLSKYFLQKDESLVHGAEIFDGFIYSKEELEKLEEDGLARKFFTFQFAENAIRSRFASEADQIMEDFVKMLVFDAITGNNDRHFYNWGVIKHISNKKRPTFAPIYDSARGLFWNRSEDNLNKMFEHPKQIQDHIRRYSEGSKPKTGWEGLEELNHFQLVEKIFTMKDRYKNTCKELINSDNKEKVLKLVDDKFSGFYSANRKELIKRCITYRFDNLIAMISDQLKEKTTMLNWISKLLKNEEQESELIVPRNAQAQFELRYSNLPIGYLKVADGYWTFFYSEEFKRQNHIDVLIDFPNKEKIYRSEHLWPFFAHRIPGLGQPQVKSIMKEENIDPNSEVDLLRRFGRKSITNPFELASQYQKQ